MYGILDVEVGSCSGGWQGEHFDDPFTVRWVRRRSDYLYPGGRVSPVGPRMWEVRAVWLASVAVYLMRCDVAEPAQQGGSGFLTKFSTREVEERLTLFTGSTRQEPPALGTAAHHDPAVGCDSHKMETGDQMLGSRVWHIRCSRCRVLDIGLCEQPG